MKLKSKLFKPNMIVVIATDANEKKVYTVDTTTRKFYVHSQNFMISENLGIMIALVLSIIIPRTASQFRSQLYIGEVSQGFKILLIVIGILIGISMFWLKMMLNKKNILHLDDYFKKRPQSVDVSDINRVIGKAVIAAIGILAFIFGGAIGSIINFNQFLNSSNLSTYFWAVLLFAIFSFSIAEIRTVVLVFELKGTDQ